MSSYVYSDVDPKLNLTKSDNVRVSYDVDAIIQSLRTLLATITGERVRSDFGGTLVRLLFQPMNDDIVNMIRYLISDTIAKYEPRVVIRSIIISPDYDRLVYEVRIDVYIVALNTTTTFNAELASYL
jgi:phage baseplate assembly protein W